MLAETYSTSVSLHVACIARVRELSKENGMSKNKPRGSKVHSSLLQNSDLSPPPPELRILPSGRNTTRSQAWSIKQRFSPNHTCSLLGRTSVNETVLKLALCRGLRKICFGEHVQKPSSMGMSAPHSSNMWLLTSKSHVDSSPRNIIALPQDRSSFLVLRF
jgi:hypothetical protein